MLMFRILCAVFVAWAMNWAFTRPEAAFLLEEMPEFAMLAPLAGAVVGFQNLARRQGWGMVVAVANGLWSGFMSLILASCFYIAIKVFDTSRTGRFDTAFVLDLIGETTADVVDYLASVPLVVIVLGATAVVGVLTELIHWALVRLRKQRGIEERNTRRAHRPSMY
ncbi:MAG: hypothetical protein AAGI34_07240 [Pseudomonadota bacterium]